MSLAQFIEEIIEPTFGDFEQNPRSVRHAYLACVVTYHAIDRVAYPKRVGNMRKKWRHQSADFAKIDIIAHHFKHVLSDAEPAPSNTAERRIADGVFGWGTIGSAPLGAHAINEGGIDLIDLRAVVRRAITFLREQTGVT